MQGSGLQFNKAGTFNGSYKYSIERRWSHAKYTYHIGLGHCGSKMWNKILSFNKRSLKRLAGNPVLFVSNTYRPLSCFIVFI